MIFEIEVTDAALWAEYQRLAAPVMAGSGGRFLAFDPNVTPLEGNWHPKSLSIVEFPNREMAQAFYDSPEYQSLIPARQAASRGKGVLITGLSLVQEAP